MKKKNSIVVPIDFSAYSEAAYKFALGLAEYMTARIKLVHVMTGEFTLQKPMMTTMVPTDVKVIEKKLRDFAEQRCGGQGTIAIDTQVETEVLSGASIVGVLSRISKNFDLIVVGAKGEKNLSSKIFGSIPSRLAQKTHVPVLIVPEAAEFYAPKKMLYASNWESCDDDFVAQIIKWANSFAAYVAFVHVSQDYSMDSFEKVKEEILEELVETEHVDFSYLITETEAESPLVGIQAYADKNDIDWIVLVNRQRGFFNNVLGLSLSKEISVNPKQPILIFQDQ